MDADLNRILRECAVNTADGDYWTFEGNSKQWSVGDSKCQDFWVNYCQLVHENNMLRRSAVDGADHTDDHIADLDRLDDSDDVGGKIGSGAQGTKTDRLGHTKYLCLAEIPKKHMPIIVDCNFCFQTSDDNFEPYTDDFLYGVIYCCQQAMLEIFDIVDSPESAPLLCCVLESPSIETSDGQEMMARFRLQFPYCKTTPSDQVRHLRPAIIKLLRQNNVIRRLTQQPTNDWPNIIDASVYDKCVMYGSSNNISCPPYELLRIHGKIEYEDIDSDPPSYDINAMMPVTNHEHVIKGLFASSVFADKDADFWMPLLLSTSYWNGVVKLNPELTDECQLAISSQSKLSSSFTASPDNYDIKSESLGEYFVTMISPKRANKENYWLDVGKALYNVYEGSQKGMDVWIRFTEDGESFTPDDCELEYSCFNIDNYFTVRTLAWYARLDNPVHYKHWHDNWCEEAMDKATSSLHNDVAEALYRCCWLEFACTGLNVKKLYHFKKNVWRNIDNGVDLKTYLSGEFVYRFETLRTKISMLTQQSSDVREKDNGELLIDKIGKLINHLKNRPFKENIVKEVTEKLYNEKMSTALDSNPDLTGMVNCVIEAGTKVAWVRPGKPEDYISKSTGLVWNERLHWKHPLVLKLTTWFRQAFPDKHLYQYFSKFCASCLKGRNNDKILPIFSGNGNNSKSMIKRLFQGAFGPYVIDLPVIVFTGKDASSGPRPELARAAGAKIAFVQEPDADEPLKTGPMKRYTGDDTFFARGCNVNGGDIEPTFKLVFLCNDVPGMRDDDAIRERTRIFPFLSKWKKDAPKNKEEQYRRRIFQVDPNFNREVKRMAPAFMWYMVQCYSDYCKTGLEEPAIVKDHTKSYWLENDVYAQFIAENLERAFVIDHDHPDGKSVDGNSRITLGEMFSQFREWFRENYPNRKCHSRSDMNKEISKKGRLGPKVGGAWRGVKFSGDTMANI